MKATPALAVLLLVVLTLSAAVANAAAASPTGLAGDQSIQFSVDDNFTLSSFQGQMISYQRFLSDRRAIRLSAGLFLDRNDSDFEAQFDDDTGAVDLTGWNNSFTVKGQFVFYRGDGPLYFIWGGGPKLTYANIRTENASGDYAGGEVGFTLFGYDYESFGVGLEGFAGVEWFINEMFSLHAEYGASAMYRYENDFEERIETDNPDAYISDRTKRSSPSLDSDGVRFGLSAHF